MAKTVTKWAILGALQGVEDVPTVLVPATHGLRTTEFLGVDVKYSYDGKRPGKAPGTAARLGLVGPEGRYAEATMKQEGAGAGAAYSATVLPTPHLMLRMNGFDAVVADGASVTYTPADEGAYAFTTMEAYERGQKYSMKNVQGDGIMFGGELGQIPVWESALKAAVTALPIDAAIPVGVVYNSTPGAKATQMLITVGDYVPVRVHEFKFMQKRNLQERAFDNVAGVHGGFHPDVERQFSVEFFMEAAPMPASAPYHTATALNPRALLELAEELGLSFQVGATAFKKYTVAAGRAVIGTLAEDKKGALAMIRVTLDLFPSTESTNDECTITFD